MTGKVYFVRHGETAWTISDQHTGRTDIPLTERGRADGQELSARLRGTTSSNPSCPCHHPAAEDENQQQDDDDRPDDDHDCWC
jgi:broad specificity phosphatase PhoE